MKYFFELSSRAEMSTSTQEKHKQTIVGLKSIESPWGIAAEAVYPVPRFDKDIVAVFVLNKLLGNGVKGYVLYRYRNMLRKTDSDRIFLQFNPKKIDYQKLINKVFKQYIDFFSPNVAQIFDELSNDFDYERFHSNKIKANTFRFSPVTFWDKEFCIDYFGISLHQFKNRIADYVEHVELYKNGIIIVLSYTLLSLEKANEIDSKLKSIINIVDGENLVGNG